MRIQCKFLLGKSTAHTAIFEVDQSQALRSVPTPVTELRANICEGRSLSERGGNSVLGTHCDLSALTCPQV